MKSPRFHFTKRSELNVTPYIDILLVLLVVFMIIQPQGQHKLDARTTDEQTPKAAQNQTSYPAIVLSLDDEGFIRINQEVTPFVQLGQALFDILSRRSDTRVFVRAEPGLPFGDVVRLIDVAKGAGAGDVGLLTVHP